MTLAPCEPSRAREEAGVGHPPSVVGVWKTRFLTGAALLLAVFAVANGFAQETTRVIRAAAWVTPDGAIEKDALVVIRDGVIEQVGGNAPEGATVENFERAVLCPGLIDALSSLSAVGQQTETRVTVQPGLRGADSLNRFHPHLKQALSAGVTAFALASDDQNVVSGRVGICLTETAVRDYSAASISDGPLKLSLSPAAFVPDRDPTSRAGAIAAFRTALEAAKAADGAKKAGVSPVLADFANGKLSAIAVAPSGQDVLTFAQLASEHKLQLCVQHTHDAREIASEVARLNIPVIVGPLNFDASPRDASAPAVFEAAKAKVAIGAALPFHASDGLRIGAAVAVRNGMSAQAARRAITSVPAEILGVADKMGSIKKGNRGDLVIFSGDPLDLRSRVSAVFSGGRRVFTAIEE